MCCGPIGWHRGQYRGFGAFCCPWPEPARREPLQDEVAELREEIKALRREIGSLKEQSRDETLTKINNPS